MTVPTVRLYSGMIVMLLIAAGPQRLDAQAEFLSAIVRGDTVTIVDSGAVENCAARHAIELTVNGTQLTMLERDTVKEKAFCMCDFVFTATMAGLAPGTYSGTVYREYRAEYNYPKDTVVDIGFVTFTIASPGAAPVFLSAEQSPCLTSYAGTVPAALPSNSARVYPQPLRGDGMLLIEREQQHAATVAVYDLGGRLLAAPAASGRADGTLVIPLASSLFPTSGVYLCAVTAGGERAMIPFLVLR
jgi:hypothetical protein